MGLDGMKKTRNPSWVDMLGRNRKVGDEITGEVVDSNMVQQYAFGEDGKPNFDKPLFWDAAETKPKTMPVITIKYDNEKYPLLGLSFTGNGYTALNNELTRLEKGGRDFGVFPGDKITVKVIGEGTAKARGHNPPLLYATSITPGSGLKEMKDPKASSDASASTPSPTGGVTRPANVPEVVWNKLSDDDKVAMAAQF